CASQYLRDLSRRGTKAVRNDGTVRDKSSDFRVFGASVHARQSGRRDCCDDLPSIGKEQRSSNDRYRVKILVWQFGDDAVDVALKPNFDRAYLEMQLRCRGFPARDIGRFRCAGRIEHHCDSPNSWSNGVQCLEPLGVEVGMK